MRLENATVHNAPRSCAGKRVHLERFVVNNGEDILVPLGRRAVLVRGTPRLAIPPVLNTQVGLLVLGTEVDTM